MSDEATVDGRRAWQPLGATSKMRSAVSTASLLSASVQAMEHEPEPEPMATWQASLPPPVNKHRMRLRRRIGPVWACVTVMSEHNDSGPYESMVCCKFCGSEWLSDEARIREHVNNFQFPNEQEYLLSTFSLGKFLKSDSTVNPQSATASNASSSDVSEVAPPPPCTANLMPSSGDERDHALRWIAGFDFLQFCTRVGITVTAPVASAMRRAEAANSHALLYPTKANMQAGADATSDAEKIVGHALASEWQSVDKLRFTGCGLQDDDCYKIIDVVKQSGVLRELREISIAQNAITDDGFEAFCRELATPLSGLSASTSPSGSNEDLEALGNEAYSDDEEGLGVAPALLGSRLKALSTFRNPIGNRGLAALAAALDQGGLPHLSRLDISGTAIVNADGSPRTNSVFERTQVVHGMQRSDGAAGGPHANLILNLDNVSDGSGEHDPAHNPLERGVGDEGIKKFAFYLHHNKPTPGKLGMLTQLTDLRLFGNSIGDEGLIALSMAFGGRMVLCRNLEHLWLNDNYIGDKGLCFMVDTLFNGGMVNLKQLLLADNIISNAGSESLADALKRGALAKLRKLSLSGNALMDHAVIHLNSCLLERCNSLEGSSCIEIDLFPELEQLPEPSKGRAQGRRGTVSGSFGLRRATSLGSARKSVAGGRMSVSFDKIRS